VTQKKDPAVDDAKALVRDFKIVNRYGIHARPAALFVKTVSQFQCDVTVEREGLVTPGRSIMGLLTLEGSQGSVLRVKASGPDAGPALNAIGELIEKKFYED
jgi:phosphocarrier protein HPr